MPDFPLVKPTTDSLNLHVLPTSSDEYALLSSVVDGLNRSGLTTLDRKRQST